MLIKNIAFSGIMAAIVMSAGAAMAADPIQVPSTTYVREGDAAVLQRVNNNFQRKLTAGDNITIDDNTISATVPDVSNLATKAELNDYAKTTDIPTVPANVSAFTNDAGYLTAHQDISGKQDKIVAGSNITIGADGKTISATVPTNTSELTNDSGYLTTDSDTKYTAGTGVQIDANNNNAISVDTTTIATKSSVDDLGTVVAQKANASDVYSKTDMGALSDYAKRADYGVTLGENETLATKFAPAGSYATTSDLDDYVTTTTAANTYATRTDVGDKTTLTTNERGSLVGAINELKTITGGMATDANIQALSDSLDDKEDKVNKVTSISSTSTDTQYPSAAAVYGELYDDNGDAKYIVTSSAVFDSNNKLNYIPKPGNECRTRDCVLAVDRATLTPTWMAIVYPDDTASDPN